MKFRNIAIIAHVDHGKTTLVDGLLKQGGAFSEREKVEVCVMDSNAQEKERGITIYAKNTAVRWGDVKINILDTPGHADFGSEVERVLRMVDCVCLVVDAYEGPMPQTKFVLRKSLELGLKPIVVLNKIDKPTARPVEVVDEVFDLFVQLGATDAQLDFPVVYAIAREGIAKKNLSDESKDLSPLFETILAHAPEGSNNAAEPFKMQIANLGYDNYLGRLGIGRVYAGVTKVGQNVTVIGNDGKRRTGKIAQVFTTFGLQRNPVDQAEAGDVITIAGIPDIYVGETVSADANATAMPPIHIDEPTLKMTFRVNDSPLAGREGKKITSRNIRERLEQELETNVGMKVDFGNNDEFIVSGRGELHLSVVIESMRREGFELSVGAPEVIMRVENGVRTEPYENAVFNIPTEYEGGIMEQIGRRKGIVTNMSQASGLTTIEVEIPTRGLLGYRSDFMTNTRGQGILYSAFSKYGPYVGTMEKRQVGSMVSSEDGQAVAYALWKLQERGPLFTVAGDDVYVGMILGEHLKGTDLDVNACKEKQLTNVRSSCSDDAIRLTPIKKMSLEEALCYVANDEWVEVTPKTVRLRKKYLDPNERKRFGHKFD